MVKKKVDELEELKADVKEIKSMVFNIVHKDSYNKVVKDYKWYSDPWQWFALVFVIGIVLFSFYYH
jgi:hypothetical protein